MGATSQPQPLSRFLVPVDGSESGKNAAYLAGSLAVSLGDRVKGITLLHVLAGGYLSRHMVNIDKRTEYILENISFKKLRQEYVERECAPFMEECASVLRALGVKAPVDQKVLDGRPADKIIEEAESGAYSTIIMGRRGLSPVKELLLGSVTSKILHLSHHPSLYVVGQDMPDEKTCLVPGILIPVDGSSCSMAAVREAAVFGKGMPDCVNKIVLLRVIDLATYEERTSKGESPEADAEKILSQAAQILMDAGISEHKVKKVAKYGRPVTTILDLAAEEDINIIIIGRYGRSALKDMFVGGVSSQVLHRAEKPSVAIVNVER